MLKPICPIILGLPGPVLDEETRAVIKELNPAGFILFGRNIETVEQVANLTDELAGLSPLERPLIAIDQEGGRVQRIRWKYPQVPDMRQFGMWYQKNSALALEALRTQLYLMGHELADLGFTLNFAPVCDVATPSMHDVIGKRAFSADPGIVGTMASAAISGLLAGGVWPCLKHAPGHGRAEADSHTALPMVNAPLDALKKDFSPFIVNKACPFLMTAHITFTELDAEACATDSKKIIQDLMRDQWEYTGVIISDDLGMEALEGSIVERGQRALAAGCDLAIVSCSDMHNPAQMDAAVWAEIPSLAALPSLTHEAEKALNNAPALPKAQPNMLPEAEARLTELLAQFNADVAA